MRIVLWGDIYLQQEVLLDRAFYPLSFKVDRSVSGSQTTAELKEGLITITTAKGSQQIEVKNPYPSQILGIIACVQQGKLRNGSFGFKLFSPPDTYGDVDFRVKAVGVIKEYLGKRVGLTKVSRQTPLSLPPWRDLASFYIDNYGRPTEIFYLRGARMRLVKSAEDAKGRLAKPKLPTFSGSRIVLNGRRNPFRKDLVLTLKDQQAPGQGVKPSKIITPEELKRIQQLLNQLDEKFRLIKGLSREGKEEELRAAYRDFMKQYLMAAELRLSEGERKRLEDMKAQLEKIFPIAQMVYQHAEGILHRMQELFEQRQLAELDKWYRELEGLARTPELEGTRYKADIKRVLEQAEHLIQRAKNVSELLSKKLLLSGIFYIPPGEGLPSYAILNNRVVKEGYVIQDVLIKKINPSSIVVEYKGERMSIYIQRGVQKEKGGEKR
jgi:hypothetical protein